MLNKIINFSLHRPIFILSGVILLIAGGYYAMKNIDIDVFPDLTAPTVVIMTDAGNMATEEVERQVTFPIESAVNGAVNVRRVRSSSATGTSFVWVEFDWGTDIYRARQITAEKIATLEKTLPEGITPLLAPQSSIMGEVLFVGVTADSTSLMDLRSLTDWVIKPALLAMGGVAQVTVMGGYYKQYQILADPIAMQAYNVNLDEIAECMSENRNSAGGILREYGNEFAVRGVARTARIDELESSPIKLSESGQPICVRDVAEVKIAPSVNTGFGSINAQPAILITVSKQPDVNTLKITESLLKGIESIKQNLPPDVKLNTEIFRQSDFIEASVNNVGRSLFEGAIFVIVVLMLFLGSFRTTLISIIAIPLSLLGTVIVLYLTGQDINTMTLGGMCIAIGSLVDDAIIDVENVYKKLQRNHLLPKEKRQSVLRVVYVGSTEIRASILNATFIIIVAFTPLFFLSGMEGRMLKPLGLAYIISLLMSLVVAITITPLLCKYLLGNSRYLDIKTTQKQTRQRARLKDFYQYSLIWALAHKKTVMIVSAVALALAIGTLFTLGNSFLPDFNEGSLTISAVSKPGVSLDVSHELGNTIENELLSIDEVISTARRTGRGELDEHAQASNSAEIEVKFLLNKRSKHEFLEEVRAKLAMIPGVVTSVGQPLSHRIDHILSGTQANIAIKVFGPDLTRLYTIGHQIQNTIRHIEGVTDLNVEQQTRTSQLQIRADRPMLARYGITLDQFNRFVETAFPGAKLGDVYEGQRRFDLVLKLKPEYTESMEGIAKACITTSDGRPVPLHEVAEIVSTDGPNAISHENVQRKLVVSCNVAGRDMKSVVDEIRKEITANIDLDENYRIEYGGQFESAQSASRTLICVFLAALLVIFFLLYSEFRKTGLAFMILVNLPLAMIGGVFAVKFSSGIISIPSIIGFITLFGIAIRNGILLVAEYERLLPVSAQPNAAKLRKVMVQGSVDRFNPIMMTALTAALALIPLIWNGDKSGNEIQAPMGIVVLGGLITSTMLNIYVVPALYEWYRSRRKTELHLPKNKLATILPFCMLLLVVFTPTTAKAQQEVTQKLHAADYTEVLETVDRYSPLLQASRQQTEANIKGNHTGIVPANPEFLFGYYHSNRNSSERMDFEAVQNFDFPSVYVYKTRMAKLNDSAARHCFDANRAEVLMQTQNLCIELIYFNILQKWLDSGITETRKLADIYRKKLEKGESNIIEVNRAELSLLDMERNLVTMQNEKNSVLSKLKRLTGGMEVDLRQDRFPDFEFPDDFETWFAHVSEYNPTLKQLRSTQAAKIQNVKVNISESLPKLSIAYKGENVFDDGFNAVAIGMSIPLWENKNRVKQAKLEAAASQYQVEDTRLQLKTRLEYLHNKVAGLLPVVLRYREAVLKFDNTPYLEKAMEKGVLSLFSYLEERQTLFDMMMRYLQAEKDLALSWSELQWLSGAI